MYVFINLNKIMFFYKTNYYAHLFHIIESYWSKGATGHGEQLIMGRNWWGAIDLGSNWWEEIDGEELSSYL